MLYGDLQPQPCLHGCNKELRHIRARCADQFLPYFISLGTPSTAGWRRCYHNPRHLCILPRVSEPGRPAWLPPHRPAGRPGTLGEYLSNKFNVRAHVDSLPEEKRIEIQRKANEARSKLNPAPQRKKELSGERLRIIEETTDKIKNCLTQEDISYGELARRLNMTPGHISHLMSGTRNMTLSTLADIAEAMGYQFTVIPHKINERD